MRRGVLPTTNTIPLLAPRSNELEIRETSSVLEGCTRNKGKRKTHQERRPQWPNQKTMRNTNTSRWIVVDT
jgi:hypothetical protein